MNMTPLRGLPFGVRLNARLGCISRLPEGAEPNRCYREKRDERNEQCNAAPAWHAIPELPVERARANEFQGSPCDERCGYA
jgi:hypothetical protein